MTTLADFFACAYASTSRARVHARRPTVLLVGPDAHFLLDGIRQQPDAWDAFVAEADRLKPSKLARDVVLSLPMALTYAEGVACLTVPDDNPYSGVD